jgi:polar amino acid transport system substrate-binding protein
MPQPGHMPSGTLLAKIAERGYLKAGVDQTSFQWSSRDPVSGRPVGFDVDMLEAVAKAIFGVADKTTLHFIVVTNEDRFTAVADGRVDILAETATITCDRKEKVDFSTVYYTAHQRLLVRRDSGIVDTRDLASASVCAVSGSTSLERLRALPAGLDVVATQTQSDCLALLQDGRVDAVSTDDNLLLALQSQDRYGVKLVGAPFSEEPYGLVMPLGEKRFVGFVNGVLEDVRAHSWADSYRTWIDASAKAPRIPQPEYLAR